MYSLLSLPSSSLRFPLPIPMMFLCILPASLFLNAVIRPAPHSHRRGAIRHLHNPLQHRSCPDLIIVTIVTIISMTIMIVIIIASRPPMVTRTNNGTAMLAHTMLQVCRGLHDLPPPASHTSPRPPSQSTRTAAAERASSSLASWFGLNCPPPVISWGRAHHILARAENRDRRPRAHPPCDMDCFEKRAATPACCSGSPGGHFRFVPVDALRRTLFPADCRSRRRLLRVCRSKPCRGQDMRLHQGLGSSSTPPPSRATLHGENDRANAPLLAPASSCSSALTSHARTAST